jgi:CheY-like chemotaxis protein
MVSRTHNKLRILVVDSYVDAADSLALLLTHWGYDAQVAYGGREALAVARWYRPDFVLAELKLSGLDGFRLAEQLRNEAGEEMELIALTGFGDDAHRRRARASGFDSLLIKSADPENLRTLLGRLAPWHRGLARPRGQGRRGARDGEMLLRRRY